MIAERCLLWSVMTGALLLARAITADAQESDGPVIIRPPNSEIILQSGQNYSMLCHGTRPIQFKQQVIYEEVTGPFFKESRNGTLENGDGYWATIDLYNVNQFAVGYYACFDVSIDTTEILHDIVEEPNNTQLVTYTYVYVNGSTLFAPMRTLVVAKSDSKFLVECKPTLPDIEVNLNGEFPDVELDHQQYFYHPKVGFVVNSDVITMSDSMTTIFTCCFEKQDSNKTPDSVKYTPKIGFIFSRIPKRNSFVCELRRGNEIPQKIRILNYLKSVVPQPQIDGGQHYFLDGETFWMNCTVQVLKNIPVSLDWKCPDTCSTDVDTNSHNITESNIYYKNMRVNSATRNDGGVYTCVAEYQSKKNWTSFEKKFLDEAILNVMKTGRSEDNIKVYLKTTRVLSLAFRVEAYPQANFTVIKDNITLQNGKKFEISAKDMFKFKIKNLSAEDTGYYIFNFSNGYKEKIIQYYIEVHAKPEVIYNTNGPYVKGTLATVQCTAIGYPLPEIQWIFFYDDGNTTQLIQDKIINITNEIKSAARIESKLTLPVKVSGDIMCKASNRILSVHESVNVTKKFFIYEIKDGFGIENAENMWFSEHDSVTLTCLASKYNFKDVTWYDKDEKEITSVKRNETKYSFIAELKMAPITVQQAGLYICKGIKDNGSEITQNVTVTVARTKLPVIMGSPEETREINQAEKVNISCIADAIPPPKITWLKDDFPLKFDDNIKNEVLPLNRTTVNSTINISFMLTDFTGKYDCVVTSQEYREIKSFNLVVKEPPSNKKMLIAITGAIFFALIVVVLYLVWKIRKEKQFRKELAAAGLLYFKEGVTKSINPDLGIDEQAELLPYNDRFEFPTEKLKLGKQLGAGAFGVVYKAEARGIINAEETTTVAVKMVKKTADNMYIKALASELKIMVHLGKHINIVNLLGACTKNVGKRELIVIVEYCKFGNIHNYLIKHREVFIDQLNDNSEKSLGKVNRGYSCSSGNSAVNSDYFGSNHTQETDHTFLNTANTGRKDNQNLKESQNKQMELAKVSESGYVQPEWRSNYESDYSFDDGRKPRPLCSRDLLAWSFQIARGMEYLAGRKILHGDLAARNILLAEDNIVKICDFGLARSIYKNDEYQKKENSPLPVKWLAIECMTDRIFTTQSDVWSFGIVLWEIFSLAKTPYPNISPKDLLQYLSEGHRLGKPTHADDRLYNVMRQCWQQKPTARPTFTQLQEILGTFLEDNVRNHYVDLNATYMDMNVKNEGEDYLAMVSAPDYNKMVTPSPHHYVNEQRQFFPPTPTPLLHDDEGYLQMSPGSRQTFNARPQGTKFDFDARKLTPRGSDANSYGSESTPMLTLNNLPRSGSESDQEGGPLPYMHTTPNIPEETDDDVFKENNVKNIQSNQVTNPTYIMFPTVEEKKPQNFANNYINMNVTNGLVK